MDYIAFMCAIKHSEKDYVINTLKEYEIGAYLVSLEVANGTHKETDGQHFHFLVQMSKEDYHKYSKRVFVDKYKLRGKPLKDKPRQYGRVNKINDIERMTAYTLKDGNIVTNMTDEEIAKYRAIAFKVKEQKDFKDNLMDDLQKYFKKTGEPTTFRNIGIGIIDIFRSSKEKYTMNKSTLERHIRYFQMYYCNDDNYTKITSEEIFNQMFPFN